MTIIGLNTKIDPELSTLSEFDIVLGDGVTVVSANILDLQTFIGETVTKGFNIITLDNSGIKQYTTTLISPSPNTYSPIEITSTALGEDVEGITVTFSPDRTYNENCILRITFPVVLPPPVGTPGIENPTEFSINIHLRLVSYFHSEQFIITPGTYDFGDIGTNLSEEIPLTVQVAPPNDHFLTEMLTAIVSAPDLKDADNFSCTMVELGGDVSTGFNFSLKYIPQYTTSSEVTVQFFYNDYPVGNLITVNGSKTNLTVIPYTSTPTTVPAPTGNLDAYLSYINNSTNTIRITDISLLGDTLNEFEISDIDRIKGLNIYPGGFVAVPLIYTPRQATFTIPQLHIFVSIV